MPFLKLELDLGARDPEPFEDALFALGATSVTLADAADDPVLEPAPGMLTDVLAAVEEVGERHAVRSLLRRRRVAYGAGVAAATVAGVIGAVVINSRSRRSPSLAG